MSKQFWGVIAVIVLIFVGIFMISGNKSDTGSTSKSSKASLTNHVEGQGKAGVTLVEYGDYQCPFCGQYYPVVKAAVAKYNDQIHFQFRNFPLTSLHQNAFAGSRAAEAAALQNKFWEMHDVLYENQDPNGKSGWVASGDPFNQYFVVFARQVGLDAAKFKQDYGSSRVNDLINADMAEGNSLKITGTPSFFINGKQVQISQSAEDFDKVITKAIADKAKQ